MKNIVTALLLLVTFASSSTGQSATEQTRQGKSSNAEFHTLAGNQVVTASFFTSAVEQSDEEDDLPFDNAFMNWIAKLFLWFIYLSLALLILAFTVTSIISRNFWSWLPCLFFAFFYAMWLGRYWGYTACLIAFVIIFSSIKIFLLYTNPGKHWNARYLEDSNSRLLNTVRKKSRKKED
jgi:hypothetical protein